MIGKLFTLLLGLGWSAIAAAQMPMDPNEVLPCNPKMPVEQRTFQGLFKVHVACDHVLYEIPPAMLGREMLVNTEFAALSTGTDVLAPGSVVDSRVVRWVRRGNQIHLETVEFEMRADWAPNLQRGVEAASLSTIIKVFDAVAEGPGGAPIIDVTPLFVTETPEGFAAEFKRYFRMSAHDPKRSYIQSVKAFPRNIELRFYQTWTPDSKDLFNPDRSDAPPPSLGFLFQTSMLLLPEEPMKGRYADDRVGYFSVPFDDYGTPEHRAVPRAFITRYRLEKKDPDAEMSEPVSPIVFYLSREVPDKWRPYIKKGIEDWQKPFEKAGFRKAIFAKDAPSEQEDPNWDPSDVRYSVIRWTPSPRENAMGPAVVDPRSGEVISAHALFWHDVLKLAETWYFTQVGPLDPRAQKLPLPDDVMGEVLRYVVTHEVGHALGLRHNFKGHSAISISQLRDPLWTRRWGTSASIMDYARFNYVAQPGDGAALMPRFGPYDFFAIEWGYKAIAGDMSCDDEWPVLDDMAARQVDEPLLRFGGEDYAALYDPSVNTNVLGADPIEGARLGLLNIDRVMPLLIPATTRIGQDYVRLGEMYQALIVQRHRELAAVAKLVGGVQEVRFQGGRGVAPYAPVPAETQRKAAKFLIEQALKTPKPLLDPQVLQRIGPTGGADALQGSNVQLLVRLLNPAVFARLAEAKATVPNAYSGQELLLELNDGLFSELGAERPAIELYRRDLQRNYVTLLLTAIGVVEDREGYYSIALRDLDSDSALRRPASGARKLAPPTPGRASREVSAIWSPLADAGKQLREAPGRPSEFKAAVRAAVGDLKRRLNEAIPSTRDVETRLHLKDLLADLETKQ
jgi:hypothetical protein